MESVGGKAEVMNATQSCWIWLVGGGGGGGGGGGVEYESTIPNLATWK